ncbi:hypothetical protein AV530_012911 [Patagioenas fasciata monilis]|uniref:Uncharacterized protein n=1 Tax=Patagioenas fasciata monilis TaxID=372326 RepID=A0A1V4J9W0_PATFA|nr:hypothetical protein AV530_012911 [Patagioenas fasciata monilis]
MKAACHSATSGIILCDWRDVILGPKRVEAEAEVSLHWGHLDTFWLLPTSTIPEDAYALSAFISLLTVQLQDQRTDPGCFLVQRQPLKLPKSHSQ